MMYESAAVARLAALGEQCALSVPNQDARTSSGFEALPLQPTAARATGTG